MDKTPLVAVSACLLGQQVRYDGRDKYTAMIADELKKYCRLIPVCPEVEIGLGVPRTKIQLTQLGTAIKVLNADDKNVDVTEQLADFAVRFIDQHSPSGLVLQDKSPSCGIKNAKLFSINGDQIGLASGIFANTIQRLFPHLVMVQATQLQTKADIERFVKQMLTNPANNFH